MRTLNLHKLQRGISLSGLFVWLFILIVLALLGMKLIPPYMEFATARNAIQAIAQDRIGTTTPQEVRRAFDNRATIDDITAVKAADLDITKEGGEIVISFAYRKEVPLFANVGVYMDFAASSNNP
jgi:hypothetical protein